MWLRLAGGLLVLVGATMACGLASVAGRHELGALVGAFLISAVGPAAAGVSLWRLARRRELASATGGDRADGLRLMELARSRGGDLTAAEVLATTGIDIERAERLLDGLCKQGLAEHRVAEDGTIVYRVRRLLRPSEKARSLGVMDRD